MTNFYTDERTFWHSTGVQSLFLPLDRWVQPPTGSYGADTPDSKRRLLNLAQVSGLTGKLNVMSAVPVTTEDMCRVHTKDYISRFREVSAAGGGEVGLLAPFSIGGFEIAAMSAGLAKRAVDDVLSGRARNAYALCRPAGHHCLRDQAMGFCLLANIPIAIEAAFAKKQVSRVAVVDWDVHHGNGTQSIYYDRSDVLTISLHQDGCFPPGYSGIEDRGEAQGYGHNINIPLPPGSGHETYLHALEQIVAPALRAYRPDLIVVASGLDASAVDPLARMMLHSESYREMTKVMMTLADELSDGRLVVVHEGGYSEAYVPFCGHALLEALADETTEVVDPELEFFQLQQPRSHILEFHRQLIAEYKEALDII
ncbi:MULTISPECIES: class II histone deacetylase [unclassified Sphingobium]|uniref:class II histone deacetylase n=1 Tax=unclassified Sphingobium TaxID=2611147 RepID=UPI000D17C027|nr:MULTISPECIES: class II histone deacetylase [unclassified Sphingobium]MBG6120428.1 acetoin utilization deacetylase AcuC-like enzyme [Sphingobium sp. JAI105]PSO10026.1 class II histone deacetylase [Sphingobium sp. AEW4]TWC98920.1 acetoin utilization deacetylase AcuC-like enzyme [Sphingobium sp. AEW010]TWD18399.1 acetoin utilization deacetylase AcuC-like enzyme [Sphingobium sp. AEW013]TWD21027.1 acetoin utilization deacetylase AcuC-like enzyme [Sphingobium sp. AEW001]